MSGSRYIAGPWYDWIFFLAPPLGALLLGIAISNTWLSATHIEILEYEFIPSVLLIGAFTHAHLVLVFFRSHGNPGIFRLYPLRFVLAPLLLFAAMMSSLWIMVGVSVLATFWDVYHSSLQTFGFGRIYDVRAGNDPTAGRRLDWWLNLLLYAGPILGGATLMNHLEAFGEFELVGSAFFTAIPAQVQSFHRLLAWSLLAVGILFLGVYSSGYLRLARQGYQVPYQKVFLVTSTGLCSIYTWGFNSFGEAFFIMNFFHALQYFGLVWWSERQSLMSRLRLRSRGWGTVAALAVFLVLPFAYGLSAEVMTTDVRWFWALTLVVSIMHFWYDGFIWSVRRRQV